MMTNKKRYHTWNDELREQFGEKIFKVPIDGGFDCPNRDGTVAVGGCTFCSSTGSGDTMVAPTEPIPIQFTKEVSEMHKKWPNVTKYLVYFQNYTNTHAPLDMIKHRFEQVVHEKGVVGYSIATRPDCLSDEIVEYLSSLNEQGYLWVELGLQTTFDETSRLINRAHDYSAYIEAVRRLRANNICVCTHLINGLPNETPEMMKENVRRVIQDSDIQGIKLHLLHLMRNTKILRDYQSSNLKLLDKKTYINLVCDQLELIPSEIIIHRLTGDATWDSIVGPMWSLKKWEVLNAIDDELAKRNSFQGKFNCRESEQYIC